MKWPIAGNSESGRDWAERCLHLLGRQKLGSVYILETGARTDEVKAIQVGLSSFMKGGDIPCHK